jgi:hypothetical protein
MKDPRLERIVQRDGYLHLPGLAAGILADARAIYATAPTGRSVPVGPSFAAREAASGKPWTSRMAPGTEWRISMDECSPDDRTRIKAEMAPLWDRLTAPLLVDHKAVMNSFLTKFPGPESFLPLHQDPTVVDEHHHRSITVWFALDEISGRRRNGPMHLLPGSHRVGLEWRGTNTNPSYIDGLEELWARAVPIDTAAGDVILMDSRLLHGSPPNDSDEPRSAISGVFVPRTAPLCHAVGVDDDHVEVLRVDDQFFCDNSSGSLREHVPAGLEVVARVPRTDPETSVEALLEQCRRERSPVGRIRRRASLSWLGRLRGRPSTT